MECFDTSDTSRDLHAAATVVLTQHVGQTCAYSSAPRRIRRKTPFLYSDSCHTQSLEAPAVVARGDGTAKDKKQIIL